MADEPRDPTVIQFPGTGRKTEPKRQRRLPVVTHPDVPHARLNLGPITYTCPKCGVVSTVTGENLIYRNLDAYCGGCGTLFRLTNPAFSTNNSRPSR